jgi:transposase, IS30 family
MGKNKIFVLQMTKKYFHLTLEQRYLIQHNIELEVSVNDIAKKLGVHRSTVYNELKRNSIKKNKPPDQYKAVNANFFAKKRKHIKPLKYQAESAVYRRIKWLLKRYWSPEQICNACKLKGLEMISIEAIYLWIYEQKRKGIDYTCFLRRHHRKRRKRRLSNQPRTIIKNKISIHDRPVVINEQQRIGDFEVDLVKARNGYIVTITERKSLLNFIEKINQKEAIQVQNAIIKVLEPYKEFVFSITSDNGTEFVNHQQIANALGINWYFADPYKSQQRGCNENQNGLLRQFIKRDTDLTQIDEMKIKSIQNILNNRPRKKNDFLSPKKYLILNNHVALAS